LRLLVHALQDDHRGLSHHQFPLHTNIQQLRYPEGEECRAAGTALCWPHLIGMHVAHAKGQTSPFEEIEEILATVVQRTCESCTVPMGSSTNPREPCWDHGRITSEYIPPFSSALNEAVNISENGTWALTGRVTENPAQLSLVCIITRLLLKRIGTPSCRGWQ